MASSVDYYELLGVSRDADTVTIKRAFRAKARDCHPDVTGGDAEQTARFKALSEAHEVLTDPNQRAHYDRFGSAPNGSGGGADPFGAGMFGDLGSLFGNLFGMGDGTQAHRAGPREGQSLLVELRLTLEQVAVGGEHPVSYRRLATCTNCFGTGVAEGGKRTKCSTCAGRGSVTRTQRTILGAMTMQEECPACRGQGETIDHPCPSCRGGGQTPEQVTESIKVPAGVDDGQRLRVRGGGSRGEQGGPDGDLFVEIRVARHKFFERRGQDLLCEVPVTFAQAALGDSLEVAGILESVTVAVAAGTQTGSVLRVRGAGLPDLRDSSRRGDQIVVVRVATPTKLTSEQKELLFRFAQLRGEHPQEPEEKGFFERLLEKLRG